MIGSSLGPRPTDRASPTRAHDVVLIGYQDQGNLGMGYLAATLLQNGRSVELIDVRDGPDKIVERLANARPTVVGFSLIFQFFLPQFRRVASALRAAGVTSHFTVGGHYPSLCHDEVLEHFPELDSVVRYEGEATLLELVERLSAGDDWRATPGLAYLRDGHVVESEPRHLTADLDSLPFPYRPYAPEQIIGFRTLPLLASRGCAHRCSFCSIHTFYRTAPGKVVRVRTPENVVAEMLDLHRRFGVRVFLFQDDDFPVWNSAVARRWVDDFVQRLHATGLADSTIWKISCRAQYIEPELFARLRDAGLFLVYMGIESGTESGLLELNKQLSVEQNLTAVRILKQLGIHFSYGFMLLDPSSTFELIRANAAFLREIVGDGSASATFCRMLPYGGTPIRDQLRAQGRLRGDVAHPDYDFNDRRLNDYWLLLSQGARYWIDNEGVAHDLNWAWEEFEVMRRLVPGLQGASEYGAELRRLTADSNEQLLQRVERSSVAFERSPTEAWAELDPFRTRPICDRIRAELLTLRDAFVLRNVDLLLKATATESLPQSVQTNP